MTFHVVYSSDNHYAQHVGVSLLSLFEHNKQFADIQVHLIENNISPENKGKLEDVCRTYNRSITFIGFNEIAGKLKLNIGNAISPNSYARLFIPSIIGDGVDKVIYFDCDSVINGSFSELWQMDIGDNYVAGVGDTVSDETKIKVGMDPRSPYINAGMLVINLKKWREDDAEGHFIDFIAAHNGQVFHHDQGTINGVMNGKMLLLHPKYNAMATFFTMSRSEMMQYYGLKQYYSEQELNEAASAPIFVHFTPAFAKRPWVEGCKHPKAALYRQYLDMSPWRGTALDKDRRGLAEKIVAFMYNYLPFGVARGICNLVSSKTTS
jgi:lipopolysaccharide biosynthesis glycosyltransferase